MTGDSGIYCLYRKYPDEKGKAELRLMGRFLLHGGKIRILEDHDGVVAKSFPPGQVTGRVLQRMEYMRDTPYWALVREDDAAEGHHPELVPELHVGPVGWKPPEEE